MFFFIEKYFSGFVSQTFSLMLCYTERIMVSTLWYLETNEMIPLAHCLALVCAQLVLAINQVIN